MRTGNPNSPGIELWKPYEQGQYNALEIGNVRQMISLADREEIRENQIIPKVLGLKEKDPQ